MPAHARANRSPRRTYGVSVRRPTTGVVRTPAVPGGSEPMSRPYGSTTAEVQVVAARTRYRRVSTARKTAMEVLPTREPLARVEPAVVCDVDEQLGAIPHGLRNQVGMGDLVADGDPQWHEALQHTSPGPRAEFPWAVVRGAMCGPREGLLLRKEYEPPLVVVAAVTTVGGDEAGAVVDLAGLGARPTEKEVRPMAKGQVP